MNDPLSAFRKEDNRNNSQSAAGSGLKAYEAFRCREKTENLEIRPVLNESRAPSYRYLMDIGFNGDYGTELMIYFSFMMVKVAGKNMQPIVRAIIEGKLASIHEFHPNEFAAPAKDAPIITSIEYIVGAGAKGKDK